MTEFFKKIVWFLSRVIAMTGVSLTTAQFIAIGLVVFFSALFGISLVAYLVSGIRSCGSGNQIEKIQKEIKEKDKERKEELNNTFKEVNKRIENAESEVNKARDQNMSNQNTKQLESELERKAREF